jgi:hypothetical protein
VNCEPDNIRDARMKSVALEISGSDRNQEGDYEKVVDEDRYRPSHTVLPELLDAGVSQARRAR